MSRTRLKNLFIVVFFGSQLYLALPGLLYSRYETEGRFSWNMYAVSYQCNIRYEQITDEERTEIPLEQFFNRPARAYMVFHLDELPRFHEYLCDRFQQRNNPSAIHAAVSCRLNYGRWAQFIDQGVNICTAPNYGVSLR